MTRSTAAQAGRFHMGRQSEGLPQTLNGWRVTTDDANVAVRVADLLGGHPQPNEGGGDHSHEVLSSCESRRVIIEGPAAVSARWVLWGSKGIIHDCDGSEFLSPEEKKGQPCGCPSLLEDRKLAARDGHGPTPSINLAFRIATAPMLGEFHFMSSSWGLTAQLSSLTDELQRVDGPAVCDLAMEMVLLTTKMGRSVGYRMPVVKVLGSPDTVTPEPPPAAAHSRVPALPAPRRKAKRAPESTTPSVPELASPVSVDATLLRRAAQVLGTSNDQETVIAALTEVVAGRPRTAELTRLREHIGRIAAITDQALQSRDSPLA